MVEVGTVVVVVVATWVMVNEASQFSGGLITPVLSIICNEHWLDGAVPSTVMLSLSVTTVPIFKLLELTVIYCAQVVSTLITSFARSAGGMLMTSVLVKVTSTSRV